MKQLKSDAVLFDLDGVLVDSTRCVEKHWHQWAMKHNFAEEMVLGMAHGRRTVETIQLVAPHLDAREEASRFDAGEAFDTDGILRIEGAMRLVRSLPVDVWAIVTSGTKDTATTRLTCTDLVVPDILITADDVMQGKPDPEGYLLAAKRLGVAPERCVVIEDAPPGIDAAHSARMHVIAVTTTHSAEELSKADAIAGSLSDIEIMVHSGHPDGELTIRVN